MNEHHPEVAFADGVKATLAHAGLKDAVLMSASPEPQPFGNAAIVFRLDGMLLRIVRDRGQVFVDVATAAVPTEFHPTMTSKSRWGGRPSRKSWARQNPRTLGLYSRACMHTLPL